MSQKWLKALALIALLSAPATLPSSAAAASSELATELHQSTAAATAVVNALQDKINGGRLTAADIEGPVLRGAYDDAARKIAGASFEAAPSAERAAVRAAVQAASDAVIARFRADVLKGGQDAFVPAFFRAQLLDIVNQTGAGRYRALATNRASDLINLDSGAGRLVKDADVLAYVQDLLDRGEAANQAKVFDGKLVTFWPMKIAEPCAACHARNGLQQQVGQFGGATLVIVDAAP